MEIYAIVRNDNDGKLRVVREYTSPGKWDDSRLCAYHCYVACEDFGAIDNGLPAITPRQLSLFLRVDREKALELEAKIAEFRAKPEVLAYSHRYCGWWHADWELGSDVSFHVYTNFGYGRVSDFNITFKYCGVVLASYSYYVKYSFLEYADVVNCTKRYARRYSSWYNAMNDCVDFHNAVVDGREGYIFSWVSRQLEQMVAGLERFVHSDSADMLATYGLKGRHTRFTGDDFWIVKAGKIANAWRFVENIQVLPAQIQASGYAARLLRLCCDFMPLLRAKVESLRSEVAGLEAEAARIMQEGDYPLYMRLRDVLSRNGASVYTFSSPPSKRKAFRLALAMLRRLPHRYRWAEVRRRVRIVARQEGSLDTLRTARSHAESLLAPLERDCATLAEGLAKYPAHISS